MSHECSHLVSILIPRPLSDRPPPNYLSRKCLGMRLTLHPFHSLAMTMSPQDTMHGACNSKPINPSVPARKWTVSLWFSHIIKHLSCHIHCMDKLDIPNTGGHFEHDPSLLKWFEKGLELCLIHVLEQNRATVWLCIHYVVVECFLWVHIPILDIS